MSKTVLLVFLKFMCIWLSIVVNQKNYFSRNFRAFFMTINRDIQMAELWQLLKMRLTAINFSLRFLQIICGQINWYWRAFVLKINRGNVVGEEKSWIIFRHVKKIFFWLNHFILQSARYTSKPRKLHSILPRSLVSLNAGNEFLEFFKVKFALTLAKTRFF